MASGGQPVLWHIPVSHYSEKVRWALDYKGVEHVRRAPPPPSHIPIALALTRGRHYTFPVMRIDGQVVGDSSAIIDALEREHPDPPLYPQDEVERRRALELQDWFDENAGPQVRRIVWHEMALDEERMQKFAGDSTPIKAPRVAGAVGRTFVHARYGAKSEEAVEQARADVAAVLDRLESELGEGDYLVGGRFSVADLTAASLLYPLALPPEAPRVIDDPPEAYERFRRRFSERRGFRWVEEMFRRHRRRTA